jgi:hypothetical protein
MLFTSALRFYIKNCTVLRIQLRYLILTLLLPAPVYTPFEAMEEPPPTQTASGEGHRVGIYDNCHWFAHVTEPEPLAIRVLILCSATPPCAQAFNNTKSAKLVVTFKIMPVNNHMWNTNRAKFTWPSPTALYHLHQPIARPVR